MMRAKRAAPEGKTMFRKPIHLQPVTRLGTSEQMDVRAWEVGGA
jgi:hypothetical protein